MSGSQGTGFSFSAPALFFNGQNVGGNFNFQLPVVVANSATDAYGFVAGATNAAYGFLGSTEATTNAQVYPLLKDQTIYLNQLGYQFGAAADTAASKISSGGGGGGGLFGQLFGSPFSF